MNYLVAFVLVAIVSFASAEVLIDLSNTTNTEVDLATNNPYTQVKNAGILIRSSGNCHDRHNAHCTSLDGIRHNTLNGIITLKKASGCPITITGGTEVGHAGGSRSHGNGYKLDISLNGCLNHYITTKFHYIGKRGDGAAMYKSSAGNLYAHEGNHWDIVY
jgi:hypothetical protein